jgi:hypothetical protein
LGHCVLKAVKASAITARFVPKKKQITSFYCYQSRNADVFSGARRLHDIEDGVGEANSDPCDEAKIHHFCYSLWQVNVAT